jgi:acyl carrier protein
MRINKHNQGNIKLISRDFIIDNFLPSSGLDAFSDSDSLLEKGIIDSIGVLELLAFIKESFNVRVEDEEIIPDNLDSLIKIEVFLKGKLGYAAK